MRLAGGAGAEAGVYQLSPVGTVRPSGYYILEAEVTLVSGALTGAGIYFVAADASNNGITSHFLTFTTEPISNVVQGVGTVGRRYRFTKLIQAGSGSTITRGILYAMSHWGTHGSTAAANSLDWHSCFWREATAQEIAAGVALPALQSSVATLQTTTADLVANKADATRVTTLEARSGGINLLRRSQFSTAINADYGPWTSGNNSLGATPGVYHYNSSWAPAGEFALFTEAPNSPGNIHDWYSELIPVEALKYYCLSVYAGIFNASTAGSVRVLIEFLNSSGAAIGYTTDTTAANCLSSDGKQGGPTLDQYKRIFIFGQAPAGSATARCYIRRTNMGITSYVFTLRPMFSEATATQTLPAPWSGAGSEARLAVEERATADLYGRTYARWAIGATVPGATAFIEARAETTPGSAPTSDVAIGARQFTVYNPAGADWKKALEVIGGNVVLSGGLQAGAFIRLGTGVGWPVALKSVDFSANDGEVVAFGTDLGALPSLSYGMNNLAPLAAGETYDVRATSLTATGFTMRAKINVPGTPVAFNRTASSASTAFGSGGIKIDKTADANSSDGLYRITGTGNNRHDFYGRGAGVTAGEDDYDYVQGDLQIWAKKGGVWGYISSLYPQTGLDRRSYSVGAQTVSIAFSFDETVQLGDSVQEVGIRMNPTDSYALASTFTNLRWTAPGTASGVRSATPNGEKTRITVRPQ